MYEKHCPFCHVQMVLAEVHEGYLLFRCPVCAYTEAVVTEVISGYVEEHVRRRAVVWQEKSTN